MGKGLVQPKRLDWDLLFYNDIINKNGFIISEPATISLDGSKEKSMYGPQSPLYGASYEDEHQYSLRFRCKCGRFKSRQFEGEVCPFCNTKIEERGDDITVTGWITLGRNMIVNPYYYRKFQSAFGKDAFNEICDAKYRVNKNGIVEQIKDGDLEQKPKSPYSGIGIDKFYDNFDEICKYFSSKRKNKQKTIKILQKEKSKVFTSHIPIYSTMLRPQSVTSDTFYFGSLDKIINTLFNLSENVKNCIDIERDFILSRIQTKVNKMWDINFDLLNGKEGWIRGNVAGGSLNFTSRNVIICDPSLRDNEVDLSYNTFLELYKYKIIYYIMKLYGITLSKAHTMWRDAHIFDKRVYNVMCMINDKEKPRLLINRNPTLKYQSMVLMKIRKIKPDATEYCLSVPLSILPGMNADFDGDILNIIGLIDDALIYMFRKYDPISRMVIDRDSGYLNKNYSVNKDQLIDLYAFCTIGAMPGDEEEEY